MKKFNIFAMLLSLACTCGVVSCNDNDDLKPSLQTPVVSEIAESYNSLTFEWNDVANAVQYGYRLSNTEGIAVDAGVTHSKAVTITGLEPATTYTLQVWAFASMDGDYSTPPAVTLTATTDALIKLSTPTDLALFTQNGYSYNATWDAVENANEYVYAVTDTEGATILTDTTTETEVHLQNLENGEYTFSVYAKGHDGYESSDVISDTFSIDKPTEPIYSVRGTYYSDQLGESWPATMDAYADGTYSIKSFYGVEGYNFDFKVDESNAYDMFEILNGQEAYENEYKTWQVATGLSDPSILDAYPWDNYSYFEGDRTEGEVGIGNYYNNYSWGYDVFTWGGTSGDFSVDDIVGTYDCLFTGWDLYLSDYNSDEETIWDGTEAWTDWASVTKIDEQTVSIDGLFYQDEPVLGVVDFENLSIILEQKSDYDGYYTVASATGVDVPAVGSINSDGSITFADWSLWHKGWQYLEGTSVLIPSASKVAAPLKKKNPQATNKKKSIKTPSMRGPRAGKPRHSAHR